MAAGLPEMLAEPWDRQSEGQWGDVPAPTPTPGPGPTPSPKPTPTPQPGGVAQTPLLAGYTQLRIYNPGVTFPISYNVAEYASAGAVGAYVEISRPNASFSNPNGSEPDPYRLSYATQSGVQGQVPLTPSYQLPGWGVYQIRVIPLDAGYQPVGLFSNPAVLYLQAF